ncbi:MAG TPA: hydroxymethylbilane synthase [Thermopetrobacter sp.]|nr:hydroxymethylbilane synthase [Thermopetrobacter sp.]
MKIGTRGSRLALAQAHEVRRRLCAAHGWAADEVEIVVIRTTGDAVLDRPLAEIGGKGLFTKEIEEALLDGRIDGAVHSMKDMPAVLPDGLTISTMLPREDVRDAFLSARAASLDDLPPGAKLGTSSVRRAAQALNRRPDLTIVPFRGNVQTRLKKLADGVADATFLACAGLNRLGLAGEITQRVPIEVMLPAVAQGAIGVEIRAGDDDTRDLLAPLNDPPTFTAVTAERGFMAELEGSCRTPLAAHAVIDGDALHLTCEALTLNGREKWRATRTGALAEAEALGRDAGREIARRAGDKLVR